jgi:Mg2+ and Co2+ transporter CorA
MASNIDDLKSQIDRLTSLYESKTGVNIRLDTSSLEQAEKSLRSIQDLLLRNSMAVTELADGFKSSLDNIVKAEKSLRNMEVELRGPLRSVYKELKKSTLDISSNQQDLLDGFLSEKKALNQVIRLQGQKSKLQTLNIQNQTDENKAILEGLVFTESVAKKQLEIIQNSKESAANIHSMAEMLTSIPVIGKLLSGPFKDVGDEIVENTKKQQIFNQSIDINNQKVTDLKKKLESLIPEESKLKGLDGSFTIEELIKGDPGEMRDIALEIQNLGHETDVLKGKLKTLPKPLDVAITKIKDLSLVGLAMGILTKAFVTLKEAIGDIDEQSTQLARSLSISKEQGVDLRNAFTDISISSNLMTKELVDAQLNFTKLTGAASALSTSNLEALAEATELIKLSEDAQKGLINIASTTGEEYKDIENTILGTSKISQLQNGVMMDQKAILEEVLSTSFSLRVQFGNSVEEITKAVVEAKRLGFNLKDIEGIQQNLLSFESSIAAELEAELLTGKELNLEKARYFALTGNIKGLTQEINKQLGGSAEFEAMNVLQREAFAKSLGLSADKLAEILYTQEQNDSIAQSLNGQQKVALAFKDAELEMNAKNLAHLMATGKIDKEMLNRLGDKERSLVSQLSTQEEFNRVLNTMKSMFVSIVDGPVGQLLNGLNSMFTFLQDSPFAKVAIGIIMAAGIVTSMGLMLATMVQLATKGTALNPMFVIDMMGGAAGGLMGGAKGAMKMAGRMALPAAGGAVGLLGGTALGGGGTGAMIGSGIGTVLGGLTFLIPGVGPFIGSALMAGGGLLGGMLGGQFDEKESNVKVNDARININTNPNDDIGAFMDAKDMREIIHELRLLNQKDQTSYIGIQQLSSGIDMYAQRAGSNPGAAIT